jgi:hypothetical protein
LGIRWAGRLDARLSARAGLSAKARLDAGLSAWVGTGLSAGLSANARGDAGLSAWVGARGDAGLSARARGRCGTFGAFGAFGRFSSFGLFDRKGRDFSGLKLSLRVAYGIRRRFTIFHPPISRPQILNADTVGECIEHLILL